MKRLRSYLEVSFRAKVLVPVVTVMVGLTAILMWLDNRRTVRQVHLDAARQLATAEAVFKNWQQSRADDLLLRYQNVANEPRFKSVAGQTDPKTFRYFLNGLIDEKLASVIVVATRNGQLLSATRDRHVDAALFEKCCREPIALAQNGQSRVDMVRNGDVLFDLVAIPIRVGDSIAGAVCFGVENSIAQEFHQLTRSELILIADGRMVVSTVLMPAWQPELLAKFAQLSARRYETNQNPVDEITLGNEHFLCISGRLANVDREQQLGYLILSSYEEPLRVLHTTQRVMLLLSTLAILSGTAIVWYLVRKVTEPLRELRDSAEAVGLGDFSRRVEVRHEDECGELARVFNQMTENLKHSREQLESTVETLKTTQAQLIQSEKLSGIGEFIAGVAHELNNPLTTVMGFSELLQQADIERKHRRHLDMIHKSALRCQKIVQALLGFARRRAPEHKRACLNALIEAAVEILHYQLRTSNIEVTTSLDPQLPLCLVDPHQIQQVFVNIINNARQAIEAHAPSGWIRISTETLGRQVRVTIQDSGPGIPEENLSKIFDPFFTTKGVGEGTGLGLSLCYGIIKEHGGTITPRSKPGAGATFILELPIAREPANHADAPPAPELPPADPNEGAGRRVLVIDDEEPILQMVRETLERRGYEVDTAPDGETGLQRMREKQYDVALCDWKMPGLNGQQVYERLRKANPALCERMIFMTGDVINKRAERFLEQQRRTCLAKPFTLAEFCAAIKQSLAPIL